MSRRHSADLAREIFCGIAIGDVVAVPAGGRPTSNDAAPSGDTPPHTAAPPDSPGQPGQPAPGS